MRNEPLLCTGNSALTTNSVEKLNMSIFKFGNVCQSRKVKIWEEEEWKSKVTWYNTSEGQEPNKSENEWKLFEEVTEFKYLGSTVSVNIKCVVSHRFNEGTMMMEG